LCWVLRFQENSEEIMNWKQNPMNGVVFEETYQILGEWNFAVLFQDCTNENSLHFVGDIVRSIEGVATTFTLLIAPVKDYKKP
jgi:hypothetical protein